MSGSDDKMTELEWTNEQIVKLVREYKKRPMLWDTNHPLFRIQSSKYEAWGEMADIFECEIVDLKKKFNSIFASHRREKSKVRLGGRSSWFLYKHLSFLPSHVANDERRASAVVKPRPKRKSLEESEVELSCEEYEDQGNQSPMAVMIKEEPEYVEEPLRKVQYVSTKPRLKRVLRRKETNESHRPRVLEKKVFKRSEFFKKKDECDTFGEYIAMSLRKHDERTQSMIKQAINNILFEQEMKKYNVSAGQYVVISTVEENPLIIGDESEK